MNLDLDKMIHMERRTALATVMLYFALGFALATIVVGLGSGVVVLVGAIVGGLTLWLGLR